MNSSILLHQAEDVFFLQTPVPQPREDWFHGLGLFATLGVTFFSVLVATYLITYWRSELAVAGKGAKKEPPILPYWNPIFGHLFSWLSDSHALAWKSLTRYGHAIPFGLNIGPKRLYFFGEPKLANTLMKHVPGLSDVESVCFSLEHVFGTPAEVVRTMYRNDDSGPGAKPYPESRTPPERRARYLQSKSARDNLAGQNGVKLGVIYKNVFLRNMFQDATLNEGVWKPHADLWDFLSNQVFAAATEVIFGKRMLELNPSVAAEIRGFVNDLPTYLAMRPRWLAPATYRRRDAALTSIKRWLREVNEYEKTHQKWNPDHGCNYVKDRHRFLSNFEEINIDTEAAETLGLFMALIPNSLGATYWTIYEVFTRPGLVERIRPICESAVDPTTGDIDSIKLCRSPFLRSVMAEVLRMRVQGIIMRSTTCPMEIDGWKFPKNAYLAAPSNFGHLNKHVWNAGTCEAPHPVDEFWPERFLIYPDDPTSGPLKIDSTAETKRIQEEEVSQGPRYSEQGLKGAYFPFGGSMHPCPGKQFTEHEVLNTLAVLILHYDVEICVEPGWEPRMKTKHFSFGTLPPLDKAPFKIKRKQAS